MTVEDALNGKLNAECSRTNTQQVLFDEGGRAFRISGTGHTVVAPCNDDQFGFDSDFFQLLVKVHGVFDRDDHILVTMNLHDWRIVFADE